MPVHRVKYNRTTRKWENVYDPTGSELPVFSTGPRGPPPRAPAPAPAPPPRAPAPAPRAPAPPPRAPAPAPRPAPPPYVPFQHPPRAPAPRPIPAPHPAPPPPDTPAMRIARLPDFSNEIAMAKRIVLTMTDDEIKARYGATHADARRFFKRFILNIAPDKQPEGAPNTTELFAALLAKLESVYNRPIFGSSKPHTCKKCGGTKY